MVSKQNILQQKITDSTKKITELGSIPSNELLNKYEKLSTKNVNMN